MEWADADEAGEQPAHAELGGGEAVHDAGAVEHRALAGEAQVGAERQAHAAAVGRAVHRRDHGWGMRRSSGTSRE